MVTAVDHAHHRPMPARVCRLARLLAVALLAASPLAPADDGVDASRIDTVGLEVSVDRDVVAVNESFTLTVRVLGDSDERPDFSALANDFDILRRSQRSRMRSDDTGFSRDNAWELTLMPRHQAIAAIPSIPVGERLTPPVPLTVEAATGGEALGAAFVEAGVSTYEPWVHAEFTYTVRLFLSAGARGTRLSEPRARNGELLVRKLGDDRQYQTERGGMTYLVWERRYALVAQGSGPMTLEPVTLEAQILDERRSARIARFRSEPLEIVVRPMMPRPPELGDGGWLPAREVQLYDGWSHPPGRLVAGEPVTRTITTVGRGVSAAQLPEPLIDTPDGIRVYADRPELEDSVDGGGSVARRTDRFAVIPSRAGVLTLPPVEVGWWNVGEDRWERTALDAVELEVSAPADTTVAPLLATGLDEPLPGDAAITGTAADRLQLGLWQLLSAVLAGAWLATLALWWWLHGRGRRDDAPESADPARRAQGPTARAALSRLRAACASADPHAARDALLAWAAAHWPDDPPRAPGAVAERLPAELRPAVDALSRACYRGDPWSPEPLERAAAALARLPARDPVDTARATPLVRLHPSGFGVRH